MALPLIHYKFTNIDTDETLQDLAEQKLRALDRYIGTETDVKCEIEFDKVAHRQSGDVHRVEANFFLRGKLYRAEATTESFEKSVDEVRDELDKELRRTHKKRDTLIKKGGRKIKELLRFGE